MGFWQNLIGIEEDDDEEEFEEEFEEEKDKKRFSFGKAKDEEEKAPSGYERKAPAEPARTSSAPAKSGSSARRFTEQVKLVVIKPQAFEESPKLVDSLRAKKPVIINLEDLETDTARKIFDFLSGATYALNGNVQKVANNIFLFTPENVDVTYTSGAKKEEPAQQTGSWNN